MSCGGMWCTRERVDVEGGEGWFVLVQRTRGLSIDFLVQKKKARHALDHTPSSFIRLDALTRGCANTHTHTHIRTHTHTHTPYTHIHTDSTAQSSLSSNGTSLAAHKPHLAFMPFVTVMGVTYTRSCSMLTCAVHLYAVFEASS